MNRLSLVALALVSNSRKKGIDGSTEDVQDEIIKSSLRMAIGAFIILISLFVLTFLAVLLYSKLIS